MFTLFVPKHVNLSDLWNKFFLLCIFKHFVLFLNGIIFIIERAVLQSVFYAYRCSKKKKATLVIFFIYCSISDLPLQASIWHYAFEQQQQKKSEN